MKNQDCLFVIDQEYSDLTVDKNVQINLPEQLLIFSTSALVLKVSILEI